MSLKGQVSGVQKVKDSLTSVEDAVAEGLAERVSEAIKEFYGYARRVGINNPPSSPALIFARPDVAEYWALSRAKALEAAKAAITEGFGRGASLGAVHGSHELKGLQITPTKAAPDAKFVASVLSQYESQLDSARAKIEASVINAYNEIGPLLSYQEGGTATNVPHDTAVARWSQADQGADKASKAAGQSAAAHSRYATHEGFSAAQVAQIPDDAHDMLAKMWVANFAQDPKRGPCLTCIALHGEVVGIHEQFPVGLTFAKKPLSAFGGALYGPPRHPSCRCRLAFVSQQAHKVEEVKAVSESMNDYAMRVVTDTFVTKGFSASQVRGLPAPMFARLWRFLRVKGWWRRVWKAISR